VGNGAVKKRQLQGLRGPSNFQEPPRRAPPENRFLRLPPPAVAGAILDPAISSRPASSSFSNIKEMTMLLEQHIEELRREMNFCHPDERDQIAVELELAQAELAVIMAEQDGSIDAEPPF